jgi:hypothetical protein
LATATGPRPETQRPLGGESKERHAAGPETEHREIARIRAEERHAIGKGEPRFLAGDAADQLEVRVSHARLKQRDPALALHDREHFGVAAAGERDVVRVLEPSEAQAGRGFEQPIAAAAIEQHRTDPGGGNRQDAARCGKGHALEKGVGLGRMDRLYLDGCRVARPAGRRGAGRCFVQGSPVDQRRPPDPVRPSRRSSQRRGSS